jgi:hypothetical protein
LDELPILLHRLRVRAAHLTHNFSSIKTSVLGEKNRRQLEDSFTKKRRTSFHEDEKTDNEECNTLES